MELEKYKEDSYEFSGKASGLIRQLAFAGIAIIWIFKLDNLDSHLIPQELFLPLFFLSITLVLELLQYLIPTLIWSIFYLYYENKYGDPKKDIKASWWCSFPGWFFFFSKTVILILGYVYIIKFIWSRV